MNNEIIWKKKIKKYEEKGLADRPSIFSQEIFHFFKHKGKLLDLGAGPGQDSRFFSDRGFVVTYSDLSEQALKTAKSKNETRNIEYLKIDLSKKLPFADNSFDIVYSHLALHYFDEAKTMKLFREIHRILKRDGVIASLFNTIDDPEIKKYHFKKIEKNYYKNSEGIKKRYFCVNCLENFTKNLFKPILIDNKGKTHKDEIECLIRFVGAKL